MLINKTRYFLSIFILLIAGLCAQSQTYNPYSMFGIGEIETSTFGRSMGMSGTSIGIGTRNNLNISNPALLSKIDSTTFLWDFAFSTKFSKFSSNNQTENTTNSAFKGIAVGFQAMPRWALAVGVAPYSNVNYSFNQTLNVDGSSSQETSVTYYQGEGGLSKVFLSNSFLIIPKLSIGVNASYIFGSINHIQYGTESESGKDWNRKQSLTTNKLYFDFGAQYSDVINKTPYVIGLVYGNKTEVVMNNTIFTTSAGTTILDETLPSIINYIPMFYGAGASITLKEKLTIATDYYFQKCSSIPSTISDVSFVDMHKVRIGLDFVPSSRVYSNYLQLIHYQLGASVNNSYYTISNITPINYSFTFGLELPMRNTSMINLAVEFGKLGSVSNGLILERYTAIHLNISLNERWFLKRKFD